MFDHRLSVSIFLQPLWTGLGDAPGSDILVGEVFPLGLACLGVPHLPLQGCLEAIQGQLDHLPYLSHL